MPLTAEALPVRQGRPQALTRIAAAAVAVALVAGAVAGTIALLAPAAPPPPTRNPFGMGLREAAPAASGMGAYILALQASFFRSLQAGIAGLKESGAAFWSLMTIGFAYGVFHAAGPGHGKAVIAGYLVASERALIKGFALSLAAALVQALVAIAIVGVAAVALHATAGTMTKVTGAVEVASFAAVAAIGAVLTWRKAGKFVRVAGLGAGCRRRAGRGLRPRPPAAPAGDRPADASRASSPAWCSPPACAPAPARSSSSSSRSRRGSSRPASPRPSRWRSAPH